MISPVFYSLLSSIVLFGVMAGSPLSLMAGEAHPLCDISFIENHCGSVTQADRWEALEIGDASIVFGGTLVPMHASINKKSISLIFELDEERLFFVTRHNLPNDDLGPLIEGINDKSAFLKERCEHDDMEALHCLLLGLGKHSIIRDDRFSDVLYIESKSSLHGHVSRAFVFDQSGNGYFDVLISPALDCNLIGFISSSDETALEFDFELNQPKASSLLAAFIRTGNVDAELVEDAGFTLADGGASD